MSRFSARPPLSFVRRLKEEAAGGLTTKGCRRRMAMAKEATLLLDLLPAVEGDCLHALMTGRYDLMVLVALVTEKLGGVAHLRIATLSYNERNLAEMVRLIDGKHVDRLTLLCSAFFRDHNKGLWDQTVQYLTSPHRCAAARSHAKVVALEARDGNNLVIEGSANLRTNGNMEQVAIIRHRQLFDWHGGWIDETVAKHQGEGEPDKKGE